MPHTGANAMKLLLCDLCNDVVKLSIAPRSCTCGRVHGHYLANGINAVVSPYAIVVGISNDTMRAAITAFRNAQDGSRADSGHRTLAAWVMGKDAPNVQWESEP